MSDVEVVDIIADWLDEVETSAGVEWPFPTDALAAHVVSMLAQSGHTIVKPECDGDFDCPALIHIHGCYSDVGNCDDPDDHDLLIRAETTTDAEEEKA